MSRLENRVRRLERHSTTMFRIFVCPANRHQSGNVCDADCECGKAERDFARETRGRGAFVVIDQASAGL